MRHLDDRRARDEAIVESLVVPFSMVVLNVLRHGPPDVSLSDRHQPVQAFSRFSSIKYAMACVSRQSSQPNQHNHHHLKRGGVDHEPERISWLPRRMSADLWNSTPCAATGLRCKQAPARHGNSLFDWNGSREMPDVLNGV
jgi:hypothetical protein